MAVAQLLSGVSRLVQSRATVRPFFAHTAWVFALFIYISLVWWASWAFRSVDWTFPKYAYMLITPTLFFFTCSLLVPAHLDEHHVDLEAHFFQIRRPLLWCFCLASVAAMVDGSILGDEPILHRGRFVEAGVLGVAVWGTFTTNRRAHSAIVSVVLMALFFGIVDAFWNPR